MAEPPTHSPLLAAPMAHGDPSLLAPHVLEWLQESVALCRFTHPHLTPLCRPKQVHIMDGSNAEDKRIKAMLVKNGVLIPLKKYDNCYLARTDPKDVARCVLQ